MGYGWFEAVFGLWFSSTVEQPWPITLNYELLTTITPSITHNLSTMNYQLRGDIACILALKSGHPCLRTEGHESMSMGFLTSASGRRPVPCPPPKRTSHRPVPNLVMMQNISLLRSALDSLTRFLSFPPLCLSCL